MLVLIHPFSAFFFRLDDAFDQTATSFEEMNFKKETFSVCQNTHTRGGGLDLPQVDAATPNKVLLTLFCP